MNRNIIIRKSITEDKIFREPKTMQVMWYVLLNADKEQKLKTTYQQITCITGLSKPATEKALESLKYSEYISKRVSGKEISLKIKKEFPYLIKRKTQDCFRFDKNTLHFDWFNEYQTRHLWIYLLLKANTEPNKFKSTVIDKGEMMVTLASLSTATTLFDILETDVDSKYSIPDDKYERWEYLKGSKKIPRKSKTGFEYIYSEGAVAFPDKLNQPARTMLTSEASINRSSHVIMDPQTNKLRTITPIEAERI